MSLDIYSNNSEQEKQIIEMNKIIKSILDEKTNIKYDNDFLNEELNKIHNDNLYLQNEIDLLYNTSFQINNKINYYEDFVKKLQDIISNLLDEKLQLYNYINNNNYNENLNIINLNPQKDCGNKNKLLYIKNVMNKKYHEILSLKQTLFKKENEYKKIKKSYHELYHKILDNN